MKESGERDEGPNCRKSLRGRRSAKEPEITPAERVLRITPVCKEPAAREQGPRNHWVTVLIITHLPKAGKITRLDLYGIRKSASTVRQVQRAEEPAESSASYRRHRSKERRESRNQGTRESLDYGRWPWR